MNRNLEFIFIGNRDSAIFLEPDLGFILGEQLYEVLF